MINMLHALELEFLHFVHQFRNPLLDQFFKSLDFFDRQEFFFILIPIIWLCNGWRVGLRFFCIVFLSNLINHSLKEWFLLPRPFHLIPQLGLIQVSGYGFPSGAAQTAALLAGLFLNFWKSSWKWVLALTYVVLISFSRVYLGVHFPKDILGGWLVGIGLWALYTYLSPHLEELMEKVKPAFLLISGVIMPCVLIWGYPSSARIVVASGVAMGISIGSYMMHRYQLFLPYPKNRFEYFGRGIIGVLGTFICYELTAHLPFSSGLGHLLQFGLLGLWLSLGSHILCKILWYRGKELSKGEM